MKRTLAVLLLSIAAMACGALAADKNPVVGGQTMYPTKDIIDNAVNSADHTTLVAAVKAAGLVDTLKGAGPFTVFAPTNEAFAKLPAGTVETLLKPENKEMLTKILTYHVVAGRLSSAELKKEIRGGHGRDAEDGERRHAHRHDAGIEHCAERRKGRPVYRDHPQRVSVQRRDPCGRHRRAAQLGWSESQRRRVFPSRRRRVPHLSFAFGAKEGGAFDYRFPGRPAEAVARIRPITKVN